MEVILIIIIAFLGYAFYHTNKENEGNKGRVIYLERLLDIEEMYLKTKDKDWFAEEIAFLIENQGEYYKGNFNKYNHDHRDIKLLFKEITGKSFSEYDE